MQFMNALVGTAATKVGKAMFDGLRKSMSDLTKESKALNAFSELLNHSEGTNNSIKEINLGDLKLKPEELNMVLKLREIAMNQGQDFVEFELQNQAFKMDVETLDMRSV